MSLLTDILDSKNPRAEAHLAMTILASLAFIIFTGYVVIKTGVFDAQSFGMGFGLLFAGGGVAAGGQGLQRKLESDVNNETTDSK
jgi:hypothetical protein